MRNFEDTDVKKYYALFCSRFGNKIVSLFYMRVIAIKTLKDYIDEFHQAEQALLSWHEEAIAALWASPNELKAQYKNASILNEKRVVFNIHGNSYRLVVILNTG